MKSTQHLSALRNLAGLRQKRSTASRGERVFGALFPNRGVGWGGSWASDRSEQVQHMKNWTYVAIDTIATLLAQVIPNFAYVSYEHLTERKKSMSEAEWIYQRNRQFSFSGQTFHSPGYKAKALSVVKPHEELEPLEPDHLCRRIIENPNPVDTSFDMFYELDMFMELTGVGYLWAVPNGFGLPCELWVIPSHWVWPRTGGGKYVDPNYPYADHLIQYYEVRPWGGMGSAGILKFPPNEVISFPWKSPLNKIDGYSKLSAIAQWIDSEESIGKSRFSQFNNMAMPSCWIEMGEGYDDPDDDKIARIEAKFMAKYVGEYNTAKPFFGPAGSKLTPLSFNPEQMMYVSSEESIRDSILSAFRVPGAAVGLVKDMTYGSLLATLAQLCAYCLNPRFVMMGLRMTKFLASRFSDRDRQIRIWYDDCVPPDPTQLNADIQADVAALAICPNEIRAIRGRHPWRNGGDDPFAQGPGGMTPIPIGTGDDLRGLADLVPVFPKLTERDSLDEGGEPGTEGSGAEVPEPPAPLAPVEPNGKPGKRIKALAPPTADSTTPTELIDLPDIRQHDSYSCGSAAACSVGRFFGVGPETLEEWKTALGTTEKDSTRPEAIVDYLTELGLQVTPKQGMTVDDLAACWKAGCPVITPIREYGVPSKQASAEYGHYVAVIGVAVGQVIVQDPSIMNVLTDSHEGDENLPEELRSLAEEFIYLREGNSL